MDKINPLQKIPLDMQASEETPLQSEEEKDNFLMISFLVFALNGLIDELRKTEKLPEDKTKVLSNLENAREIILKRKDRFIKLDQKELKSELRTTIQNYELFDLFPMLK